MPGRGFGCVLLYGPVATLLELQRAGKCRVRRYYATSGGSIMSALFMCAPDDRHADLLRAYARHVYAHRTGWIVDAIRSFLELELPEDGHALCTGRLFISYYNKLSKCVVSEYATRADLIDAIVVSCSVPGICAPFSVVWDRWDGLAPCVPEVLYIERVPLIVLESMPRSESIAINAPFLWFRREHAKPLDLFDSLDCATRDGFARVEELERVLPFCGVSVEDVRAAADTALARLYVARV